MASKILLALAVLCIATQVANSAFTADFTLTGPADNGGFMTGTIQYDYAQKALKFVFASNGYIELHRYNDARGAGTDFKGQYIYQTATTNVCNNQCGISPLKASMPQLDATPAGFTAGPAQTINGVSCTLYTTQSGNTGKDEASKIWMSGSTVCALEFRSGRRFTFSNVAAANGLTFGAPADCECQKKLDISLLLDGSGSISNVQWQQINDWVRNLITMFTFGPNNAALAISVYSASGTLPLPLTSDLNTINQLMATNLVKPGSGTNVLASVDIHKANTFLKLRAGAIPIMITVTDGADKSSAATITSALNELKASPYNIKTFVGIFNGENYNTEAQMIALAGGDVTRVFNYSSYDKFKASILEVVAAACESDAKDIDCGVGCCGFCMCTTCVSPNGCEDGDKCTDNSLAAANGNLQCCSPPLPRACGSADRCVVPACNAATGACDTPPKDCQGSDKCKTYSCDSRLGCQEAAKCVTDDKCKIPRCDAATGTCAFDPKPCQADDKCHSYKCVGGDCIVTLTDCDDGNLCTSDTCDNAVGCVHAPQDCNCTCPENSTVCEQKDCKQGFCVTTSKCLASPDPCFTYTGSCTLATGCEKKPVCDDNDPCTENVCTNGQCTYKPIVCDDNNACTDDKCVAGNCTFTPVVCTDQDKCNKVHCDDKLGCVQVPIDVKTCDDFNVCTQDKCDPAVGCVNINWTTTNTSYCDDGRPCTIDSCDPVRGCESVLMSCPDRPKCDLGVCENGTCTFFRPELCQDEIIAIGVSAGAIAGIVIGIAVCLALTSFAAFKGYQAYNASKDLDDVGQSNPLYETGGNYGENKLFGNYEAFKS